MDPRQRVTTPPVAAVPADRALDSREKTSRAPYVYRPASQLPDLKEHPDWTARWVRFRIKAGADDPGNLSKQRRDGYEPVPFDQRYDVLVDGDSVFAAQSGNIEIGDLILCRRNRYKSEARKQYYENVTRQQLRGARHELKKAEHPKYPGTISDNSTTAFAGGRAKQVEFGDD